MRRLLVIVSVSIAVLGACGGGSGRSKGSEPKTTSSSSSGSSTSVASAVLDDAALGAMLPPVEAFPPGWAVSRPSDATGKLTGFCGKPLGPDHVGRAENLYAKDADFGPAMLERLLSYATVEDAHASWEQTKANADACDTYEYQGSKVTVGHLAPPALGDEALALRLSGDEFPTSDFYSVRVGRVGAEFIVIDVDDPVPYMTAALARLRNA